MTHERPPAVVFGPFRFEPGNGLWRDGAGSRAAAARAGHPRRPDRAARRGRLEAAADRCRLEGRLRHRRLAPRGHQSPPRRARRRPPQADVYPDRPPPRLPLHRTCSAPDARAHLSHLAHLCTDALAPHVNPAHLAHRGAPTAPRFAPCRTPALWRPASPRARRDDRHRDGLCAVRPAPFRSAADDALHDRLAGQHGDRSAARLDCGLGRRHAHGLCRAQQRPAAPVPPHDRSRRAARHRRIRWRLGSLPLAGRGMGRVLRARQPEEAAHRRRNAGGDLRRTCRERRGWSADGTIVFGGGPGGGLARVSADGGEPVVLTAPAPGSREVAFGWPDILPDGTAILYTAVGLTGSRIALHETATGVSRPILDAGAFARYSPTGHLVFERRGRLEAAPFSLRDRRVTAASRPILRGLATSSATLAGPRFAFSTTGSLLYVPGTSTDVDEQLHWLDIRGGLEPVAAPARPARRGRCRAGSATARDDGRDRRWHRSVDRRSPSRRGEPGPRATGAAPARRGGPMGSRLRSRTAKAGPFNLFLRPADTDAAPTALFESPWNQLPTSWSPDGRLLAFTEFHPMTGADVWVVDVATRERRPLVRTLFDESHARISPDGRWMAYMSNEAGRWDVFIRPVDRRRPAGAGLDRGRRLAVLVGGWPDAVLQQQRAHRRRRVQQRAFA